ncbi:hypothetical protein GQ53DRAFT_694599 [Thozetella sp. PMI_491]|nr:hypothetical protein GQ53DRAFT_694599 [Thozetella sp. PMI_491]
METIAHPETEEILSLSAMPQQRFVRRDGDDWTGITRSAERRKLQNRLNQRAHRQRKYTQAQRKEAISAAIEQLTAPENAAEVPTETGEHGYSMLITAEARHRVLSFARAAYESFSLHSPRPTQLHLLIKLNALNAFARNAVLLGYPTDCLCADEMISFFPQQGPRTTNASKCPESLQPTTVQLSVIHHPWLDLIPFPVIRNRAIRAIATGLLDEDELCTDLMEVDSDWAEAPSIIVWGDSSNPDHWEATLPFFEKYGWLVWGSSELLNSTNAWRARRGEEQIGW